MKRFNTIILVALAATLTGCQSGKSFNPLASVSSDEAPYTEEELAAVERAATSETKPVSFTGQLKELSRSQPAASPRSFSTRRS